MMVRMRTQKRVTTSGDSNEFTATRSRRVWHTHVLNLATTQVTPSMVTLQLLDNSLRSLSSIHAIASLTTGWTSVGT